VKKKGRGEGLDVGGDRESHCLRLEKRKEKGGPGKCLREKRPPSRKDGKGTNAALSPRNQLQSILRREGDHLEQSLRQKFHGKRGPRLFQKGEEEAGTT